MVREPKRWYGKVVYDKKTIRDIGLLFFCLRLVNNRLPDCSMNQGLSTSHVS